LAKHGTPIQINCSEDHYRILKSPGYPFVQETWQSILGVKDIDEPRRVFEPLYVEEDGVDITDEKFIRWSFCLSGRSLFNDRRDNRL
jgi:hypothetical protein